MRTKNLHEDFLKTTIGRAPAGDPRIEALTDTVEKSKTTPKSKKKKSATALKKRVR